MPSPAILTDSLLVLLARLIDAMLLPERMRDKAKLALLAREDTPELQALRRQLSAAATPQPADPWTGRARPAFLYVMYAMILWSVPVGVIAALSPATADAMIHGMSAYLGGLPEPLYALFAAGYLGYATLRQWGKARGTDR